TNSRAGAAVTTAPNVSKGVVVSRIARLVLVTTIALFAAAPVASASPTKKLDNNLSSLWTTVFQTPSPQNAFGSGGAAFACWHLGKMVAPFAPFPVDSCTVSTGTRLFITGSSFECSTFEGNGTTDAELRACARAADAPTAPTITIDGRAV